MIVPASCAEAYFRISHLPRDGVDLDRDHVGDEAVGVRRVDAVVVGRRRRARDVEDLGGLDAGAHPLRQRVRVPVRDAGDPAQRDRPVGAPLHAHLPPTSSRSSAAASSRLAPISRICRLTTPAERSRPRPRRSRRTATSRARRDRPDRRVAVELVDGRDVVGRQARARRRRPAATAVSWPWPCGAVPIVTTTLPLAFTRTCAQSAAPDFGL